MVEIQVGSKQQPIIILPRINGTPVTVTQIKNDFSNFYVSDIATPINFVMETRTRLGAKVTLAYDESKSSETEIWFLPDDSFFATVEKYTTLIYWTIAVEQVYTENPFTIDVKELHDT
jgi:hypothetical protein